MSKQNLQDWVTARSRFQLSHAHVQMARELGLNPKKLGKIDNHHQEPWKRPLPEFIQHLYRERFGRPRPEIVMSIEERSRLQERKKSAKKEAKRRTRELQGKSATGIAPQQAVANEDRGR